MLYDPKWFRVRAANVNPISVEAFAVWLGRQSPDTKYNYTDIDGCPLALYLKSQGYQRAFCAVKEFHYSPFWFLLPFLTKKIPRDLNDVVASFPHNYGAALERAHAALTARNR